MPLRPYAKHLEGLYERYNRPEFVHPDPLEFVRACADPGDREVVGLVAAVLAYGNVKQILRSVASALERLGEHPRKTLMDASANELSRRFAGFKHRFTAGDELASLLSAAGRVILSYGSLEAALVAEMGPDDQTVIPALGRFVRRLAGEAGRDFGHLLTDPARGSACKRLNLLLRWMVRRDSVDVGTWRSVPAARLVIPLDTHMHSIALSLGATRRKAADLRTALEITAAFRAICPEDPVRYDFCLTRLGIHPDGDKDDFLRLCGKMGHSTFAAGTPPAGLP